MGNAIITFFMPFDPTPYDKKSHSEHQTLFPLFGRVWSRDYKNWMVGRPGNEARKHAQHYIVLTVNCAEFDISDGWMLFLSLPFACSLGIRRMFSINKSCSRSLGIVTAMLFLMFV